MGFANDLTQIGVTRVVKAQAVITASSDAVTYLIYDGSRPMFAALFGGVVVIISSWWLANRLRHATEVMSKSAETFSHESGETGDGKKMEDRDRTMGTLILFAGLGQRLLFIGAAFAYGIGYLGLPPLPMIVTFALASAGNVFVGRPS